MANRGSLKTTISKGQLIFTLTGLVSSIVVITLLAIFSGTDPLAIVAMIFFGIIALSAIALLFGLLLDYCFIKDGVLYMHYIFKSSKIALKDIGTIVLKDNVYTVYDKYENRIGTFNATANGADKIIIAIDNAGAKLK